MTLPGSVRRPVILRSVAAVTVAVVVAAITAAWTAAPAGATTAPVIVIVMENKSYTSILGSSQAPFINKTMISNGLLETHYSAIMKSSGHNYLAMTSGVTDRSIAKSSPNVFSALGSHTPWRAFEESMPSVCYKGSSYGTVPGSSQPLYTIGHDPAVIYNDVSTTSLCNNVVPLDTAHFDATQLPAFSYVVPNECNDMHTLANSTGCPMWNGNTNHASSLIASGDAWLSAFVPAVASSATVVLTWDEGSGGTEHVVTVAYGAGITGSTDATTYNHYSLEAGLYSYFGLGTAPGNGATATPMNIP